MHIRFSRVGAAVLRYAFVLHLSLLAAASSSAGEQPVPIAAFFGNVSMSNARLSPDGKRLAMLVNNEQGHDQLGVVTLADKSIKVVAGFSNADVGHFEWVNNERLLYDSRDKNTAPGEERYAPGLFAVNIDGGVRRQLVEVSGRSFVSSGASSEREKMPWNTFMLDQPGAQDSNWVYVEKVHFGSDHSVEAVELIRLDTVSGRTDPVPEPGQGRARAWWLDAKGRPALATTVDGKLEMLHYLDPKDGRWRKLATQDAYLGGKDAFTPLGFSPEGSLYVVGRPHRDKAAPFVYDLATGKMAARPLVDLEAFDFSGELVVSAGKLLGIRYTADTVGVAWFDPAMKEAQAAVDRLLPGHVNVLSVGLRSETPFVLVRSWSDRQPGVFLLFDRQTGKLSRLGSSRPAIDPARMAAQDLTIVTARDGRTIPTWLTVPNNSAGKKLPMVVLVHGGPYVRGRQWGWDSESQFLASRGYLVLEPEFRGSTGYGEAHFRAGWKQWGLAMQDDIADATRWAIAQGMADPQRICIAGASYGGYATLMGLIRDPDLYKCGIDWVGVTDIELLYTGSWTRDSDTSDAYKRYGMPTLVGDPAKDAAQFAATSPLKQAVRLTQPLLLAYGGADLRVPLYHGRKLFDAVKRSNKDVEWVVYDDEAHGWKLVETRLDFWGRVETFLRKNIGKAGQ
ncbi:alpha/beta hydrolase family protein [Massilia aerilata]|uniref:Alpha/beta hydrolase family protein n=1 Tax=Massilia aerilata TaxID=453817 RepID=A0ABW0RZL0_9BURK